MLQRERVPLNGISSCGGAVLSLEFELCLALLVVDKVGHFHLPIRTGCCRRLFATARRRASWGTRLHKRWLRCQPDGNISVTASALSETLVDGIGGRCRRGL